jgi:RecB family endonuclease NucS
MNWQPAGSTISLNIENGVLLVRALRRSPRETLVLRCGRVYLLAGLISPRPPRFYMYLSESQIRDILASNPHLIEDGLRIAGIERPVNPGFVDMYGYDKDGRLVVFEIKRVKAGEEAARQLLRYVEALRSRGLKNLRGVLLAPDFTESAIRLLEVSGLEYKRIDIRALYEMASSKGKLLRPRRDLLGYIRDSRE